MEAFGMKLTYKINLIGLLVLTAVGLAIAIAGVSTISKVSYDLNRKLMSREVDNVVAAIRTAHNILVENRLDGVQSYKKQAQLDVLEELTDYRYGHDGQLVITNSKNEVIKPSALTAGHPVDIEHIPAMIQNKTGTMEFVLNGKKRFFSYKTFPQWDWLVILSVSSEEMLSGRNRFIGQVVIILLISLVLGALVFIWFIRRVVSPIRQLADATTYVSAGKWDTLLPEPQGSDEVAQLATAFQQMAGKLSRMYGRLEQNLKQIEQSQNALKESEEKYRDLVQLLPLTVYEADINACVVYANQNAFDTFGFSKDDLVGGLSLYNLIIEEDQDRVKKNIARLLNGESPGMTEYTGIRKDKSTFPGIAMTIPIYHLEKTVGFRGIFIDITERKTMELELFKNRNLESIGVLAGGIAHDFNNILMAILGNLSLAKMFVSKEEKIYDYLEASEKASLRARDLTLQLLTFSRGGTPVKQTVSLSKLIEESATFPLSGSKVRSELDIAPDLWPVDVDKSQVSQVIHNMVMNASQSMADGGVIHIKVDNRLIMEDSSLPLKPGTYICIAIKDNGTGIPPEMLPDIFDPYFTTKEMGKGLGLTTAFSIIKRHDGFIQVESPPGQGTTFSIYLPASEKKVISPTKEKTKLYQSKGKILIMDDEISLQKVMGRMLTVLGYTPDFADDGAQALEKYQIALDTNDPFDLVIMDLTIPGGMGGQIAIKKLLDMDTKAKAIVASGYSDDPVMADHKAHGFSGMLAKPFELKMLSQVIHDVLVQRKSI